MSIRETVMESMKSAGLDGYLNRAQPVIQALEDRETVIVSSLVAYAVDQGLDRDRALVALADCGLDVTPSEPAEEEDPRIARLDAQIAEAQDMLRQLRGE